MPNSHIRPGNGRDGSARARQLLLSLNNNDATKEESMPGMELATPRLKSIQRIGLTLLVVAGVVNYIDRATLAVANPLIREELGLSIAEMGYLLSAFLWAYAFSQLPTGAMVDRLGPRLLLTLGLSLWSFAQLLGGMVQNFTQFFGARVLLGVGEAPQFPTGARVVRDWFNQRDRGLATGVFNCASSLGTAIAVPLLTYLMLSFGWRVMFAILPRSISQSRKTLTGRRATRRANAPR
jgi:sugar phosphate permease